MNEFKKLSWDKSFKTVPLLLLLLFLIIFLICLFTNQDTFGIIVLVLMLLGNTILVLYLFRYTIKIYDSKVVINGLLKSKEYNYSEIIIKKDIRSIRLFDLGYNELCRIALFLDTDNILVKKYNQYCTFQQINKKSYINNKIKYNFYIKNFSIFGLLFGLVQLILSAVLIYFQEANIIDVGAVIYIFVLIGFVSIFLGFIGLLHYKNFNIIINDNKVYITNYINRTKTFNVALVNYFFTGYKIKVFVEGKKVFSLLYYFLDNSDYILKKLKAINS